MKPAIAHILVELHGLRIGRETKVAADRLVDGHIVAGDEQVGPAIIVVIEEPCRETLPRFLHTSLKGDIGKRAVVIVVIKKVVAIEIGNVEINIAIIVIVGRNYRFGVGGAVNSSSMRNVFEGAVSLIPK